MVRGALAWAWALVLPWAYVLPAERVIEQIDQARATRRAVSLRIELEGPDDRWPPEIQVDVHPVAGLRVDDLQGGRWVVRRGRVLAASGSEIPVWLPQLEFLVQPSAEALTAWLVEAGVDIGRNVLGRCGADDCFVLGGRDGVAQLWVDKDAFQPRAWVSPTGRRYELEAYASWGGTQFPSRINIMDDSGRIATLRVLRLEPAAGLGPEDFSAGWARP